MKVYQLRIIYKKQYLYKNIFNRLIEVFWKDQHNTINILEPKEVKDKNVDKNEFTVVKKTQLIEEIDNELQILEKRKLELEEETTKS